MARRNVYRVIPAENLWQVTKDGIVLSSHFSKNAAIENAKKIGMGDSPCRIIIHKQDGSFQTEYSFPEDLI